MSRGNEKSLLQLFAERFLPTSLLLEINRYKRITSTGKVNMLNVLKDKEQITGAIEHINVEKNIVICSKSNENVIRQNFDGTLNLYLNRDENLSIGKSAISGSMSVFDLYPQIKMSIPQGIRIDIVPPIFRSCFFDKIYTDCKIFHDKDAPLRPDMGFPELPSHFIMQDFIITFYIDVVRLREINKTFLLKKGQPLADIVFTELMHYQNTNFTEVYLIQDTEIYETFIDVF